MQTGFREPLKDSVEDHVVVTDLKTTFQTKHGPVNALDGISYSIPKGKTLGIVGESGCGKTVTSYSIMGLIDPPGRISSGSVKVSGQELLTLSEHQMEDVRGHKIAMIFQEPMTAFNPVLTVGKQITEQMLRHLKITPHEAREKGIELLNLVGIPSPKERFDNYPHQLSGGMRQRAMIAMALSCDPEFLIADEPTTALDVTIQAQILDLIQGLQDRLKMTVQFITHDLGVISEVADEVLVMYMGRVCEQAPSQEIFHRPRHPYTKALLQSIPKLGQRVNRLPTIEGNVPALINRPTGCAFQGRCPFVTEECRTQTPPIINISPGHRVACFHPVD